MANDPASAKHLGEKPSIHRTANVRDTVFGRFCEVGARTKVAESSFGDYSYVVNDSDIIYTTIGRFCSIAAHTRINPGNHPLDRVMLSHVSYRSSAYGLGPDDPGFFDWRRSSPVALGHDVWIGHAAIVLPGVSRMRFAEPVIEALGRIAWWDWPHHRLHAAMSDIRRLGAAEFCARHDPGHMPRA
jgi:carbonic anhydrase/acetyltransferase-like protein (isoleucine patch superfamily)